MKYCVECGRQMTRRWVEREARERHVCSGCGVTHYENPRIIVGCLVCWRDKVLMCRRAHQPGRGQWMIPLGYLECGETLAEGAARETREETGVAIDPYALQVCSILDMPDIEQVGVVFRANCLTKPQTHPGIECLEVAFMAEAEIPVDRLAWREALGDQPTRFFSDLRSGEFSMRVISGASEGARRSPRRSMTSLIRRYRSLGAESDSEM